MKKVLFLLVNLFCLSISCKKSEVSEKNLSQYAIYTAGFEDGNKDQGVAVVTILQHPDRKVTVETFTFVYNEKDIRKIKSLCIQFSQQFINNDKSLKKYSTVGDYINGHFKTPSTFKKAGKLSHDQTFRLVNNLSFDLAAIQKPDQEDWVLSFLKAVIPSANAQVPNGGKAVLTTYVSILGGTVLGTFASLAGLSILPAVGVGIVGGIVISSVTGTSINGDLAVTSALSSLPRTSGALFGTIFNSNQLGNSMSDFYINDVLKGLSSDPNYRLPETAGDLLPKISEFLRDLIKKETITCSLSAVTNDPIFVNSTSAKVNGEIKYSCSGGSNFVRGICISKTKEDLSVYNPGVPATNGVGTFTSTITSLDPGTTYYYRAYVIFNPNNIFPVYGDIKILKTRKYAIGDTAFGGIIFYLKPNDSTHGMVCSLMDQNSAVAYASSSFGNFSICVSSGTQACPSGFGYGKFNTTKLVSWSQVNVSYPAAIACRNFSGNGFTDWSLPSKDELNHLYINRRIAPNLTGKYWTSSYASDCEAWVHDFNSGAQSSNQIKPMTLFKVRAVRDF